MLKYCTNYTCLWLFSIVLCCFIYRFISLKCLCVTFLLFLCFSTFVFFTTNSAEIGAGLREIFYFYFIVWKIAIRNAYTRLRPNV